MNGELNMKFQVSLYGDFSLITPTEETIKKCIERFFTIGLLPGNLQEFDPQSNKLEPRLSLQSMRNGLTVNILRSRIDFIITPLPGTPGASVSIESFFEQVVKISELIRSSFDVSFKRIGVVTEKLLKEITEEKLDQIRRSFINPSFSVIPEAHVKEWNIRNILSYQLGEPLEQEINAVYTLAKVKIQMGDSSGHKEFETLLLSTDITIPMEKRAFSLSSEHIEFFLNNSKQTQQQIYNGLTEVIYGAN